MVYDIFYVSNHNINEQDWKQFRLRFPSAQKIDNVTSFSDIKKKAFTKLFWVVWDDTEISSNFKFDYQVPEWDQDYIHVWLNGSTYDGVVLFSKNSEPTKKEFDHRFYLNKKEVEVIASLPKKFQIFNISSYTEYLKASETSSTELFWVVFDDLVIEDTFSFDTYISHHDFYNRNENHVFLNNTSYDGLILASKNKIISKKEFDHRFLVDKKEWDVVATRPKPFEVYHLNSYKEFLSVKESTTSNMFWVVWNDIVVAEDFKFDYYVPVYDTFHRNITHIFKNRDFYDGICLFSKYKDISKNEFEHRFFVDKVEVDVIASTPKQYDQYIINSYSDYLNALKIANTEMFWGVWSNVKVTNQKIFDTYFNHHARQSRIENHVFKNICNGQESFVNGITLFSKNTPVSKKEIDHKFLINKKEYEVVASQNQYPKYTISNYDEYLNICQTEKQPLFWCVWPDIDIIDSTIFDFYFDPFDGRYDHDRSVNHMFKNQVGSEESFISGIALCSPSKPVSKKEIEHRFFMDKKEQDRLVSRARPYEKFIIETFKDYEQALAKSTTDMFWLIPSEVEPLPDFKFDLQFPYQNNYERGINHVFKNKDVEEIKYNGIMLLSKKMPISAREVEYRYLIEKKEYDTVASELKLYDIIFISYNEPNADENFAKLLSNYPRAKRIHGVKGIHQAHIAAAKLATTPMFWVVDGDAIVEDNFKFDLLLPKHDTDIVHVWLSKNPINGLTYGYGGVKLLPKYLTENMDLNRCSIDMTMSISNKFKVVPTVSNITAFNTDPFNTWKSAFRECVKLVSRPVDPKYQEETEDRLNAWCILGSDMPYGDYALSGAIAGRQFGIDNIAKPTELARINDFEWLLEQFQTPSPLS
jgi:hypothetical protein